MMDITTLKSQIKSNRVPHLLIFAGDEWQVQKIYIDQIVKVTGLETRRPDTVREIVQALKNKSFVNKSYVYIVRDDKEFMQNEKMQERIIQLLGDNFLISLITRLDKRLKFYNRNKGTIIEFEALQPQILRKYIKQQLGNVSDLNCDKLIKLCEGNYGRILLEIDKIKNWHDAYVVDKQADLGYEGALLRMITSGIIYEPPQDAIFDLVAAIMQRQRRKVFELLQESYASGEATMVILTVLFNNAKAVLQVQSYKGSGKVTEATGLTGFHVMKAKEVAGHYSEEELINMLHLIRKMETGIKTGKIEDRFAVPYLLCQIL